ncbi:MAG: ribosomal-protein-alanine N-acetyltransferase [Pseudoalteromonas tetraodonis]
MEVNIAPITEEDIMALYPLGNDKDVSWMAGGGLTYPVSYEEFRTKKTIAISPSPEDMASFAIRWNNTLVGSIGYFRREEDLPLEIGYWLGKKYWGKGIVTFALQLALKAMQDRGIFGTIIATTMPDNLASRHILLVAGFQQIGTEVFDSPARKMEVEGVHYSIEL